jgi:hypothetical protein
MRGFLNVGLVFVECADAGDAKKIFQFAKEARLIIAGKIHGGRNHRLILSAKARQRIVIRRVTPVRKQHSIPEASGRAGPPPPRDLLHFVKPAREKVRTRISQPAFVNSSALHKTAVIQILDQSPLNPCARDQPRRV